MGLCTSKPKLTQQRQRQVPESPRYQYEDTVEFIPPFATGQVVKVYDGDTITIASKLPGNQEGPLYRVQVRLAGIDTPEMKTANDDEKVVARQAQQALSDLIMGKVVILKNTSNEKFGRLLADVYLNDLHINRWMLDRRYAIPYDGGTKTMISDWKLYHETGYL